MLQCVATSHVVLANFRRDFRLLILKQLGKILLIEEYLYTVAIPFNVRTVHSRIESLSSDMEQPLGMLRVHIVLTVAPKESGFIPLLDVEVELYSDLALVTLCFAAKSLTYFLDKPCCSANFSAAIHSDSSGWKSGLKRASSSFFGR